MTLYDASRLQSIDSGDPGIVGFFLGLFLETVPPAVADIRAAFLSGDLARVSSLAHRIKPSIMELHIPVPIAEIEMAAGLPAAAGLNAGRALGTLAADIEGLCAMMEVVAAQMREELDKY